MTGGVKFPKISVLTFLVLLMCGCLGGCGHEKIPPGWKTECIGRYTLSVPGEVEFALTVPEKLVDANTFDPFRFADGSKALHTVLNGMDITHTMTLQEFEKVYQTLHARLKGYNKSKTGDHINKLLPTDIPSSFLLVHFRGIEYNLYQDNRVFLYKAYAWRDIPKKAFGKTPDEDMYDLQIAWAKINKFKKAFRTRAAYEVPQGPGICLPYGFIADNGTDSREVAVTMRLKGHPDVEVFFQDSSGPAPGDLNAEEQTVFFWENYNVYYLDNLDAPPGQIKLGFPMTHLVWLDGRLGLSSFGEIFNPDAKVDTPNLILSVRRTGVRAKGTPVSDKELKAMAEKIAASIKHR